MNNFVTEISEEDFRRMNLVGYKHAKISVDGRSYRMGWKAVNLNDLIDEELNAWDKWMSKDEPRTIVIAIHTDAEKALEYEKIWEDTIANGDFMVRKELPDCFYYMDKWLNHLGATTYQIGVGIPHIYSTRDYYERKDGGDYWRVKKDETDAIYLIHLKER